MRKALFLAVVAAAVALGAGAGYTLKTRAPSANGAAMAEPDVPEARDDPEDDAPAEDETEFMEMKKQFIVPVVKDGTTRKMVVMGLSLAVAPDTKDKIVVMRPRLRDSFLQMLLTYANDGGFDGAFTSETRMRALRHALDRTARRIGGEDVKRVLITNLVARAS